MLNSAIPMIYFTFWLDLLYVLIFIWICSWFAYFYFCFYIFVILWIFVIFCWFSSKFSKVFVALFRVFPSNFLGILVWGLGLGLEFGLQAWACSLQCSSCQGLGLVPEPWPLSVTSWGQECPKHHCTQSPPRRLKIFFAKSYLQQPGRTQKFIFNHLRFMLQGLRFKIEGPKSRQGVPAAVAAAQQQQQQQQCSSSSSSSSTAAATTQQQQHSSSNSNTAAAAQQV